MILDSNIEGTLITVEKQILGFTLVQNVQKDILSLTIPVIFFVRILRVENETQQCRPSRLPRGPGLCTRPPLQKW